jgi:hypothetical protein
MSARSERAGHDPQGSDTRQPDGTGTRAKQGRELSDDDDPATVIPQPVHPDGSTREKKRPRVGHPAGAGACDPPPLNLLWPRPMPLPAPASEVSLLYH